MAHPERVLIVDDNAMFLALAARALEAAGHEVRTVAPASEFDVLKVCMEFRPRLAVIDYHMPRCNPETLVLILKEDPAFQPLLILGISTSHDQAVADTMVRAGADHFTHKGSMSSLEASVQALLD